MARDQLRWQKTGNNSWAADKRDYTAEIEMATPIGSTPQPYTLTIEPGTVTSSHDTLGQAKRAFQKFLFDKPVE